MKRPSRQGAEFLADVAKAQGPALWWLGQSGFLFRATREFLLVDPYLSDSLTRKYAGTATPHERVTENVIEARHLDFVDWVCCTHGHTDHLDGVTLRVLLEVNAGLRVVIPESCRAAGEERTGRKDALIGMDAGETLRLGEFEVTALAAAHEELETDERGHAKYLSYVLRFGGWTVYHAGDTVVYEGLGARLAGKSIDVALLPINGRPGSVPGNMTGEEAVGLAREAGFGRVVPCHFDLFAFNTADPGEFAKAAEREGVAYAVLRPGDRLDLASRRCERVGP